MRIVLDTNIVVRAAGRGTGLARELLLLATGEPNTIVLSHSLFAEIEKVLYYPRMRKSHGLDDAGISEFLASLLLGADRVAIPGYQAGPLIGLDPKDDMVLLTATAGGAEVLGTNNRHFFAPEVVQYATAHGVRILRDVELIAELRQASG